MWPRSQCNGRPSAQCLPTKRSSRREVRKMVTDFFEIVPLNDLPERPRIEATEANGECRELDLCVDYCSPSGCLDTCMIDFNG